MNKSWVLSLLFLCVHFPPASAAEAADSWLLTGARIFDGEGVVEGRSVWIRDGVIAGLPRADEPLPPEATAAVRTLTMSASSPRRSRMSPRQVIVHPRTQTSSPKTRCR